MKFNKLKVLPVLSGALLLLVIVLDFYLVDKRSSIEDDLYIINKNQTDFTHYMVEITRELSVFDKSDPSDIADFLGKSSRVTTLDDVPLGVWLRLNVIDTVLKNLNRSLVHSYLKFIPDKMKKSAFSKVDVPENIKKSKQVFKEILNAKITEIQMIIESKKLDTKEWLIYKEYLKHLERHKSLSQIVLDNLGGSLGLNTFVSKDLGKKVFNEKKRLDILENIKRTILVLSQVLVIIPLLYSTKEKEELLVV